MLSVERMFELEIVRCESREWVRKALLLALQAKWVEEDAELATQSIKWDIDLQLPRRIK